VIVSVDAWAPIDASALANARVCTKQSSGIDKRRMSTSSEQPARRNIPRARRIRIEPNADPRPFARRGMRIAFACLR
jgi:hypothetical protein